LAGRRNDRARAIITVASMRAGDRWHQPGSDNESCSCGNLQEFRISTTHFYILPRIGYSIIDFDQQSLPIHAPSATLWLFYRVDRH
jgi:hypothetical protein